VDASGDVETGADSVAEGESVEGGETDSVLEDSVVVVETDFGLQPTIVTVRRVIVAIYDTIFLFSLCLTVLFS